MAYQSDLDIDVWSLIIPLEEEFFSLRVFNSDFISSIQAYSSFMNITKFSCLSFKERLDESLSGPPVIVLGDGVHLAILVI